MVSGATLTVTAGARRYAVPLAAITEIIRVPSASPVPLAPAWLIGLINHRGAILPMIDLGQRLGGGRTVATARARVLVGTAGAAFLVETAEGRAAAEVSADSLDLAALLPSDATVAERRAAPPARAAELAREDDAEALLGVMAAGQDYAFALNSVVAVSGFAGDPERSGVMSWRGQSVPVLSLRGLLGAPGDDTAHRGRAAVVRVGDGACVALRVDGFAGILRVPARQRHPVPALLARGRPMLESLCRMDGGALVCVLSAARLMGGGGAAVAPAAQPEARVTVQDDADCRFIVFRLGAARFAAPLQAIDVVLGDAPLAPVPGAPSHIAGVRRLHGRVLPVIDLRRALAMSCDATVEPAGACKTLVVMLDHDVQACVVVDAIERILAVAPRDIQPAPKVSGLVTQVLSEAEGGRLLPVLDLPQLLAAFGESGVPPGESLAALLAAVPAQAA